MIRQEVELWLDYIFWTELSASEARSYHAAASKDWYWDGYHIAAELSEKSAIKAEPRKKYSRKKFWT